jgi:hypothetical protein
LPVTEWHYQLAEVFYLKQLGDVQLFMRCLALGDITFFDIELHLLNDDAPWICCSPEVDLLSF